MKESMKSETIKVKPIARKIISNKVFGGKSNQTIVKYCIPKATSIFFTVTKSYKLVI
jgi:hypothetical protein